MKRRRDWRIRSEYICEGWKDGSGDRVQSGRHAIGMDVLGDHFTRPSLMTTQSAGSKSGRWG